MLRTLTPAEPELVRLCRSKQWNAVVHRCETRSEEAAPSRLALKGAGTTALAIAVRSNAPIGTIQALVQANVHQLSIFHKFSGSILHEALKHRAPYNVLRYLLQTVIHYERVHCAHDRKYTSVLARHDQQGRNVLHNMVVRAMRELDVESASGDRGGMWLLFRSLVLAFPRDLMTATDTDGNSPLILALFIPGFDNSVQSIRDEAYVFRMVQLMVNTCPSVATISQEVKRNRFKRPEHSNPTIPMVGNGAPTPLTYAILYQRSEQTVRLLLEAHRKVGVNPCLTLASGYLEVPLHLAVTMGSPLTLLKDLIDYDANAIRVQDMHQLTPLDWVWIRHVKDWCRTDADLDIVRASEYHASTRRYLSSHFAGWHDHTTEEMKVNQNEDKRAMLESLLERMHLFLPAAANVMVNESQNKGKQQWSLLHAACAVPCPMAIVRLACKEDSTNLDTRDKCLGRLPLHHVAARSGYRATFPVGVSRDARTMTEPSPASEVASMFVEATRVVDDCKQLPVHIAIDTAKTTNDDEGEVVTELLRLYPDSLERRDGKTKLYPFVQAATGSDASLTLTFILLRKHPTLVSGGLNGD